MAWCTDALRLAAIPVRIDQLPAINYFTRSRTQTSLLSDDPDSIIWWRIVRGRFSDLAKQWAIALLRGILIFVPPYCVSKLLKSLENEDGRADGAWIWLAGITVSSISSAIVSHHLLWIEWSEMQIPIRAQLFMAIFQKAMKRKDSKEETKPDTSKKSTVFKPEGLNLLSIDTLGLSNFSAVNYVFPLSILRLLFGATFLWRLMGWQSALAGLVATSISVPMHTFLLNQKRAAGRSLARARDKKTKAVTEALHALRQIKFSSLEAQWEEHIEACRSEEIDFIRWNLKAGNILTVWGVFAPFLAAASSICTYIYFQGSLAPSIVFPLIGILPLLQTTLQQLPKVTLDYFGARSYASRIDGFLARPEQKNVLAPSISGDVIFRNASITWPSDALKVPESSEKAPDTSKHRFSLADLNLHFPVGKLSVISGKTGSGKTLILHAILGEVELLDGCITAPSMAQDQPVAFVSQSPWLQNNTIQNNILFGQVLDEERYEAVLTSCALRPDLASLADGDQTLIGLRGVKLSGGQKARLAFGRALYSPAKLIVLDDIFAALDSHVAKETFEALTGELGQGRTRILVTHHVSMCLPKTSYIAVIEDNTIAYAGSPDVMDGGLAASLDKPEHVELDKKEPVPAQSKTGTDNTASTTKYVKTPTKEEKVDPRTSTKLYKKYFTAAGGISFVFFYVLGVVFQQLMATFATWVLGRINTARPSSSLFLTKAEVLSAFHTKQPVIHNYLLLYLATSLGAVVLEVVRNLHISAGSLRASMHLFREMTAIVLRMPLLWIDNTPLGDMLRRFTADINRMDEHLIVNISAFANALANLMIVVIIG